MIELLLKMISAFAVVFVPIIAIRLVCGHAWQLKSFHQAVHSTNTDVNAIVTLKNIGDFISTEPFIVIGINLKNALGDFLIFFGAVSWF